jgi:hypothetical protein
MAEGTPIGALAVRIGADATGLISGLSDADKALGRTQAKFAEGVKAAVAFAGAAAAAGAAVFSLVQSVAKSADELGKLSQKVGVSVESLSALKFAAQLSDLSLDGLGTGLRQLAKNMQEAQTGTGDASAAFRALNIAVEESRGKLKPTEEVLLQVAERFAGMEDGAGKTALAMKIFGKAGADLIPFLNQGRAGIEALKLEAERLGVVISNDAAKSAEEFNDNLTRLKASSEGLAIHFSGPFIEALAKATGAMIQAKKEGEGFFATWIAGWRQLVTGDDQHKWNVQFTEATERLLDAQQALDNVRAQARESGNTPFDVDQVKKFEAAVRSAQGEVDRLRAIKPVLLGEEKPAAPGAPKGAAPALPESGSALEARARQLQAELEEEQKFQAEALAVTADFRDRELAEEKANQDARIKQLIEFYDRQQEEHIAWSQQEIAISEATATAQEKLVKTSYENQAKTIFGELASITSGVAQHNKKMFELNKIAGIANAVINAYIGISKTLSSYSYPYNIILAALHGAAAFAQVNAIRSTTFGGAGGAAPSLSGGTPAAPVTPVDQAGATGMANKQTTVISLGKRKLFNREDVRDLVDQLNENSRDGGRVVLA